MKSDLQVSALAIFAVGALVFGVGKCFGQFFCNQECKHVMYYVVDDDQGGTICYKYPAGQCQLDLWVVLGDDTKRCEKDPVHTITMSKCVPANSCTAACNNGLPAEASFNNMMGVCNKIKDANGNEIQFEKWDCAQAAGT